MKAVRLHAYQEAPRLDEVPEPSITGPHDVVIRVGGAGLCRTDLHIRDGWFAPAVPTELPLTLGHENTGWVHEVGSAVENVVVGDAVICHPQLSCGLCAPCRIGDDMRCERGLDFTGLTRAGGFAELLKTTDRSLRRTRHDRLGPSAHALHSGPKRLTPGRWPDSFSCAAAPRPHRRGHAGLALAADQASGVRR
jgi:NAD+-dependent secondary alcohol dehydrogenase Adh1